MLLGSVLCLVLSLSLLALKKRFISKAWFSISSSFFFLFAMTSNKNFPPSSPAKVKRRFSGLGSLLGSWQDWLGGSALGGEAEERL